MRPALSRTTAKPCTRWSSSEHEEEWRQQPPPAKQALEGKKVDAGKGEEGNCNLHNGEIQET